MDELVRSIDEVNLEKIKYNDQEIDRLCNTRNITIIRQIKRNGERISGSR